MTAKVLIAELTNLIQEAKKKSELRNAAEKSLEDLKTLPTTSEAQLAAVLSRRPQFLNPFIIACNTRNARLAGPAVFCLQRLAGSRALSNGRLRDVLEAFQHSTDLNFDIQLKILQALPLVLRNYVNETSGELLALVLQICSALYNSKTAALKSSASATFQQLVTFAYDRVSSVNDELPPVHEIEIDGGSVVLRSPTYDAYRILIDLCLIAEGQKPQFVKPLCIPQAFALEIVGAVLSEHGKVFQWRPEQGHLLSNRVLPLLDTILSTQISFPIAVRAIRILQALLQHHMNILGVGCERVFHMLNTMLDPATKPSWKRILCMEVLSNLFAEAELILHLYIDISKQETTQSPIHNTLDIFVRIASEKPDLIGLAHQSTAPNAQASLRDTSGEQAAMEAGGVAGLIAGPTPSDGAQVPGISIHWSSLKTPLVDQLDKAEDPWVPNTYIYSLVLSCISRLSEGLARFIIPLTTHREGQTKKRSKILKVTEPDTPVATSSSEVHSDNLEGEHSKTLMYRRHTIYFNPLALEDHPLFEAVKAAAALIDDCWPALLATTSTFLSAALDADIYHALVRSIQKLTQVAGVMRLTTPRNAFLTTLGKAAIPPNMLANTLPKRPPSERTSSIFANAKGLLSVDSLVSQTSNSSVERIRPNAAEVEAATLTPRNLLCLRALLNLAIALGPTLEDSWSVVFGALQQAETILAAGHPQIKGNLSANVASGFDDGEASSEPQRSLATEIAGVESAATRMLESTASYPNPAFIDVLMALSQCIGKSNRTGANTPTPSSRTTRDEWKSHRRMPSFPAVGLSHSPDGRLALFKLAHLARINSNRLVSYEPHESGWNILTKTLISCAADTNGSSTVRLAAANVLKEVTIDTMEAANAADEAAEGDAQSRALKTLQLLIASLRAYDAAAEGSLNTASTTSEDVHISALDALRLVLERFGDQLTAGWQSALELLGSVFQSQTTKAMSPGEIPVGHRFMFDSFREVLSGKLCRSAFGSLQLICSDFLSSIPFSCMPALIDLLSHFCAQNVDVNISLTAITFFWNVMGHFSAETEGFRLRYLANGHGIEQSVLNQLQSADSEASKSTVWLLSLIRLVQVTKDPRGDVRNSAVQTVFRILGNVGDRLQSADWEACFSCAILPMIEMNLDALHMIDSAESSRSAPFKSWAETTKSVVIGAATLLGAHMDPISNMRHFQDLWKSTLAFFDSYTNFKSHDVSASVYKAVARLLSSVDIESEVTAPCVDHVLTMWATHVPWGTSRDDQGSNGCEDTFVAYVHCLRELFRLTGHRMKVEQVESMMDTLRRCLVESDRTPYTSDIDRLTSLQSNTLECLRMIRIDTPEKSRLIVTRIAEFVALPFRHGTAKQSAGEPSFIAFSKASMDALQSLMGNPVSLDDLLTSGAITSALTSLCQCIGLKYQWPPKRKGPPIWQKATTCALAVLRVVLPAIETPHEGALENLWSTLSKIADAIAKAEAISGDSSDSVTSDESFDMDAFTTLRDLILPYLGSSSIPHAVRRSYTRTLCTTSVIHSTGPGELSEDSLDNPTRDLLKIRSGRTYDPPPNPRRRMAYLCFDELIRLVSIPSTEQQNPTEFSSMQSPTDCLRLARVTFPYLLLRAALPIKAYLADTPLRARYMPFPQSQLKELLYVFRRMRELEVIPGISSGLGERKANGGDNEDGGDQVEGREGVDGSKAHLLALFPLVSEAVRIATWQKWEGDVAVLKELMKWIDVVGRRG